MLVILLSLIVGFVIANATNKKSLKFILTYSLLSFIIIVFIFQKSCKKCKDNKECIIENFNIKQDNVTKKGAVIMIQLIKKLETLLKIFKNNKKITPKKKKEICVQIKNLMKTYKKDSTTENLILSNKNYKDTFKLMNTYNDFIFKNNKNVNKKNLLKKVSSIVEKNNKKNDIKLIKNQKAKKNLIGKFWIYAKEISKYVKKGETC